MRNGDNGAVFESTADDFLHQLVRLGVDARVMCCQSKGGGGHVMLWPAKYDSQGELTY